MQIIILRNVKVDAQKVANLIGELNETLLDMITNKIL